MNVTWRQESELRPRIAQHLSGRVRAPDAVMLRVVVLGGCCDIILDELAELFRISIAVTICYTLLYGE